MALPRVQIDLNERAEGNLTPVPARMLPGVTLNALVEVFEPEDSVAATGIVRKIQGDYVLIEVLWRTLDDDVHWYSGDSSANFASMPLHAIVGPAILTGREHNHASRGGLALA